MLYCVYVGERKENYMEMEVKAGEIYLKMAEIYARPAKGGVSLIERGNPVLHLISIGDYVQTEKILKLEGVIEAAVSALRNGLDYEMRQYLPMGYDEYVLHGVECEPLKLNLLGWECQQRIITVILGVMEAIHDAWVKEHLEELSDNLGLRSQGRLMDDNFRRLFVPYQLLGWNHARKYYLMTMALLEGCSPLPDDGMVRSCYEQGTRIFCQENEIRDRQTLQEKIMEGAKFYSVLDEVAERQLARQQSSQRVAGVIAREIDLK